ncbi:MAG: YibE/F family protein [Actinobacteria bacterium]|nr:YibE/F family protein [Actinomycetota bacterium]
MTSERSQRLLLAVVGAFALAALVGMALLWPDGDRPVLAEQLGLAGELVDATVTDTEVVPCRGTVEADGNLCNETSFEVTSGSTKGEESSFQVAIIETSVELETGDDIVLNYQKDIEPPFQYFFKDFQRRSPMVWLAVTFVVAVLALGRFQGLRALAGLVVTGVMVIGFMFPAILDGSDPTAVALVAAVAIGIAALYLTHGVTERTTVALLGTFAALALTAVLAAVFASLAHFTGFNTQDAFYLQIASAKVDVPGLVLAGIIIGSLGVLDDVTVTQVSAVWQLHQANPSFGARRLYGAALEIGRDHIASAVNTLVLAYAGASLPLLLLFTQAGRRLTDVAVSEVVAIEILRTLVGSIGLVAAVPITTALAAWVVTRRSETAQAPVAALATGHAPDPASDRAPLSEEDAWREFGPEPEERW